MKLTTSRSTGHLAMFQTVTAVLPMPSRSPSFSASPPVSTTAIVEIASSVSSTRVSATRTGSVFQIGRPSSMS